MKYTVSYTPQHQHFIDIEIVVKVSADKTNVQCPAWRPGRYELSNFVGNVRNWKAANEKNEALKFRKLSRDLWEVETSGCKELHVSYNYYAADLNAGSTYLDDRQLYMNPVNCCMYVPEYKDEAVSMDMLLPEGYRIATAMNASEPEKVDDRYLHTIAANSYEEFADSPLIASPTLQHEIIHIDNLKINIWFHGEVKPDWDRIKKSFSAFAGEQVKMMEKSPVDEYSFIYQAVPYKLHHGVEHLASTIIAIGPSYNLMKPDQFNGFLGISSHEFFHSWNIKTIRPVEMFPYDYTKPNYSRLGYVYEGVTEYYGDYVLLRSGVYTETDYFKALQQHIQKHFDNYGRFNLSVAESSFDTWIDGYVQTSPYRKVSIYTEGALIAFIVDTFIRSHTDNTQSLDDVMRTLYQEYALKGKGYREEDYWNIIGQVAGQSCMHIFEDYVNKPASYDEPLAAALQYLGLMMQTSPANKHCERFYGMKVTDEDTTRYKVTTVIPGSPAEMAGICVNDEISSINGNAIKCSFHDWCSYYDKSEIRLSVVSTSQSVKRYVFVKPVEGKEYFPSFTIIKKPDATLDQKEAYKAWSRRDF